MKILLVEDDHYFARNLVVLLEDEGFEVVVAESIQLALSQSLDEIDAIISDVMLPNDPVESEISDEETRAGFLSGVALFRRLRKDGFSKPMILFSSSGPGSEAEAWAGSQGIPFVPKDKGPTQIIDAIRKLGLKGAPLPPRAFIVHGHDEQALAELKDYLQNTLKWQEPVILREQANLGKTIIEKFEDWAGRIDCVFVLLTPDDKGLNLSTDDYKRRARQNVVFEMGFFYAQMGRRSGRVIALRKGPMELPSDILGIVWIDISNGIKAAGEDIRREVVHISA
jgi:CheY-like chemotaxis protein